MQLQGPPSPRSLCAWSCTEDSKAVRDSRTQICFAAHRAWLRPAVGADTIASKDAKWPYCPRTTTEHAKPNPDPSASAPRHAQMWMYSYRDIRIAAGTVSHGPCNTAAVNAGVHLLETPTLAWQNQDFSEGIQDFGFLLNIMCDYAKLTPSQIQSPYSTEVNGKLLFITEGMYQTWFLYSLSNFLTIHLQNFCLLPDFH